MENKPTGYQNESTLRELYWDKEMTYREIADQFDISITTVHRWMNKHGIDNRERGTLTERFNRHYKTNANGENCWLWQGTIGGDGYGKLWDNHIKKQRIAHRVAFELLRNEDLPDGQIYHTCSNRNCVNPDHLSINRPYNASVHGEDHPDSKLTEKDAIEIKTRCSDGETLRSVAEDYPVCITTINNIKHGKTWDHID